MEGRELKLVKARSARPSTGPRPVGVAGLFLLLIAAFGLATVLGADAARRPIDPRDHARDALDLALEQGSMSPEVLELILDMRRAVARRPLDSNTRVVYSSLLLALCHRLEDLEAPKFHAALSAELAPVTVPVVNPAAQILINAGRPDDGIGLIREMFGYDRSAAARLLWRVRNLLTDEQLHRALGDDPGAWYAWYRQFWSEGEYDRAEIWLDEAYGRWAFDPAIVQAMAAKATRKQDWTALSTLFAVDHAFPKEPETARLFAYRARARALEGRSREAAEDLAIALRLAEDDGFAQIPIGEAYVTLGNIEQARRHWNRARFRLPVDAKEARLRVSVQLARLEDAHGQPATALRLWREVLELNPEHPGARRRIEDLTGVRPPEPE